MAVTNRYDTFKKYSRDQINSFRKTANSITLNAVNNGVKPTGRTYTYYVNGEKVSQHDYSSARAQKNRLSSIVSDWTKQSADYYKAFGSSMLAGSNVGVDSANVSMNEVPVDRTDPILDTTSTPKRKKRGDSSTSVLGL
jgi:hypothetical protein